MHCINISKSTNDRDTAKDESKTYTQHSQKRIHLFVYDPSGYLFNALEIVLINFAIEMFVLLENFKL